MGFLNMGRLSRTKYILRNTPDRVAVTRRHHPLQGQQFDVLMGGRERITIGLDNGTSMHIPRHWTDADGAQPSGACARERVFTTESLRGLVNLVDVLGGR